MSIYHVPDVSGEKFAFEFEGTTYEIPPIGDLPLPELRAYSAQISDAGDAAAQATAAIDVAFTIFEKHCPGVIERMAASQATPLLQAYMTSGGQLGGSSPSSD